MICIARTLGAPVTVPAGKQARSTSNGVTPSRSSPTTSDTRCETCESARSPATRHAHGAGAAHARDRCARDRRASRAPRGHFSDARSRSTSPSPLRSCPRWARRWRARLAGDEPLRRRAHEGELVQLEQEEIRRRVDAPQRPVQLERLGRRPSRRAATARSGRRRPPRCASGTGAPSPRTGPASGSARARPAPETARAGISTGRSSRAAMSAASRPAPRRHPHRDRIGRASRQRRSDSPAERVRRRAAAPSARASRRSRRRGSRRPGRRASPLPRTRPRASPSRRTSCDRAAALDRLEQEAAPALTTQPEVCPERGDEVSGYRRVAASR